MIPPSEGFISMVERGSSEYAWKRWALIGFDGPSFKQPMFGGSYFYASSFFPNNWTPCWNSAGAAIRPEESVKIDCPQNVGGAPS